MWDLELTPNLLHIKVLRFRVVSVASAGQPRPKVRDEEIFAVQWRTSHKIEEKLSNSRTEQASLQLFHKIPSPLLGHVPLGQEGE